MKTTARFLTGLALCLLQGCNSCNFKQNIISKTEDLGNDITKITFSNESYYTIKKFYNENNKLLGYINYQFNKKRNYGVWSITGKTGTIKLEDKNLNGIPEKIIIRGSIADKIQKKLENQNKKQDTEQDLKQKYFT